MAVRSLSDIAAIEAVPLIERDLPQSTYAALVASAKRTPNATALTFFRSADRPTTRTFGPTPNSSPT